MLQHVARAGDSIPVLGLVGYILAEGEATGHAHAVADDIEVFESAGVLYCRAAAPFTVRHEEHKPITVPPGVYQVRRVRVYDHFSDEAVAAAD